jgi:hypothetical protein
MGVSLAARDDPVSAPLGIHIPDVVGLSSSEQVAWPDAIRDVALVANIQTIGNRVICGREGRPMNVDLLFTMLNPAMHAAWPVSLEQPALTGGTNELKHTPETVHSDGLDRIDNYRICVVAEAKCRFKDVSSGPGHATPPCRRTPGEQGFANSSANIANRPQPTASSASEK